MIVNGTWLCCLVTKTIRQYDIFLVLALILLIFHEKKLKLLVNLKFLVKLYSEVFLICCTDGQQPKWYQIPMVMHKGQQAFDAYECNICYCEKCIRNIGLVEGNAILDMAKKEMLLNEKNGSIYDEKENQVDYETGSPRKKNQRGQLMVKKKNEYIESFTMHGLSRILTGTRAESVFWLIVLTGALILGTTVVVGLVQKYLKYEVYTEVTQKVTMKNYFPSITFCDETLMLSHYFKVCGHDVTAIKKNQTCTNEPEKYNLVKNTLTNGFNWSNNFFTVIYCNTWGNKQCTDDKYLQSVKRFNNSCFTWNFNGTLFDIYGHADMSFKTVLKEKASIIALIHDPKIEEIDPTKRIKLDPNKIYHMRIQKTEYKRLPHPFPSKCTNDKPHDIFPGKYTRHKCIESIAYSKLLEKCGGVYDYHKRYIPSEKLKQYARPNKLANDIYLCLKKESFKETNEETGKCPFPCEETEFQMTTTFNERTRPMVKKDGDEIVYRIGLQYQNVDSYRLIEEKQLYGWDQILGEIGGLAGLVLGASIISLLEIFAFLLICFLQKLPHKQS